MSQKSSQPYSNRRTKRRQRSRQPRKSEKQRKLKWRPSVRLKPKLPPQKKPLKSKAPLQGLSLRTLNKTAKAMLYRRMNLKKPISQEA